MFVFALLGLAFGVGTSIPIGLVNAAVVDSACRHGLRRAVGVALGGAVADTVHSFVGVAGAGALLMRHPAAPPFLYAVSAAILGTYGVMLLRARGASRDLLQRGLGRGFGVGLALTLFNPAALAAWVAVGSLLAVSSATRAASFAAGVGAGAFAWFSFLAFLCRNGAERLGPRSSWVPRALGSVLLVLSLVALARAASLF